MPTKDSFYNIAKELEVAQENKGYLIVIRCGAFFTSIGANAIALSNELGLKLTCWKKGLCKAGVPINALYNYVKRLDSLGYNYVIYNYSKDEIINNGKKYAECYRFEGKPIDKSNLLLDCKDCEYYEKSYNNIDIFTDMKRIQEFKELKEKAGRNSYGRITVRHQGGGNRQKYRIIDFKRKKDNMEATVIGIEYDPNRSANIALVQYEDGEKAYILAPQGLKDGDKVVSGDSVDIKPGNCMPISSIPVGTLIHNIELNPGQGGKLVRTAGQSAQLMAKEGKYAHVRLPSGEMRLILARCRATIGVIGNADHENVKIGKAGRKRHMGWRPEVRGSVMNPVDHPHGGGEGKAPVGHAGPLTPWGKPALGYKTRNKKKSTNKFIVKRRK